MLDAKLDDPGGWLNTQLWPFLKKKGGGQREMTWMKKKWICSQEQNQTYMSNKISDANKNDSPLAPLLSFLSMVFLMFNGMAVLQNALSQLNMWPVLKHRPARRLCWKWMPIDLPG